MILIENPFPLFTDNNGELLESGYIFIGTAGLNPETNPIAVFWDKDLLYPAAQPIRTINGLPSRNGTATPLYTASTEYSVLTKNKNQAFISSTSFYPTEVVPASGSVTGPSIDDTAAFVFPTLLSLQKGADIAPAAGVLTLGIDGNYFDVTGTDPIVSIGSIGIGTQAILQFDDALVLTNGVNLILQGGANITTDAGGHAFIVEYETSKWVVVNYVRADERPSYRDIAETINSVKTFSSPPVLQGSAWPSFSVNRNGAAQTGIVTSTWTKVEFTTEDFDTNSNFASNRFTPTVAGKYSLSANIFTDNLNDGDTVMLAIYKNGVISKQNKTVLGATTSAAVSIVCPALDANGSTDYFEIFVWHNFGADKLIDGTVERTYFVGSRIA